MFPSICAYRATVVNSEALTGQQWLVIQTNLSDISGRTCPAYNINSCAKTHVTACITFCRTEASAKYFRSEFFYDVFMFGVVIKLMVESPLWVLKTNEKPPLDSFFFFNNLSLSQ